MTAIRHVLPSCRPERRGRRPACPRRAAEDVGRMRRLMHSIAEGGAAACGGASPDGRPALRRRRQIDRDILKISRDIFKIALAILRTDRRVSPGRLCDSSGASHERPAPHGIHIIYYIYPRAIPAGVRLHSSVGVVCLFVPLPAGGRRNAHAPRRCRRDLPACAAATRLSHRPDAVMTPKNGAKWPQIRILSDFFVKNP